MSYKSEKPRWDSIRYFEEVIKKHDRVTKVDKIEENYYCLTLADSVGIADVIEIMSDYKIDSIVTMSIWNGYSLEAKMHGRDLGVGVFLFKELMGALNLEKPELYYSYIQDGRECFEGCK